MTLFSLTTNTSPPFPITEENDFIMPDNFSSINGSDRSSVLANTTGSNTNIHTLSGLDKLLTPSTGLALFLAVTAVILNGVVLVILHQATKKGHTSSDIFLISQSVFDLSTAFFSACFIISFAFKPSAFDESIVLKIACRVWFSEFVGSFSEFLATVNCTFITPERFAKIVFPIEHRVHMTPNKAKRVLIASICYGLCHATTLTILQRRVENGKCVRYFLPSGIRIGLYIYHFVLTSVIPIALFIYCYGHMFVVLFRRRYGLEQKTTRSVPSNHANSKETSTGSDIASIDGVDINSSIFQIPLPVEAASSSGVNNHKKASEGLKRKPVSTGEKNLLLTALLVNTSFIVGNVPIRIFHLLLTFHIIKPVRSIFSQIMVACVMLNFCVDPVIYVFTLNKIRSFICSHVKGMKIK